jgi:anti-sigma regulatory factor (Ser/Thr protein kinase)
MHLELSLSNEPRTLPSVEAFVRSTLLQLPLPGDGSERLGALVVAAVRDAIENAYPAGEEGSIELTVRELAGKLEIRVRDHGLPQDVKELEKRSQGERLRSMGVMRRMWSIKCTGWLLVRGARRCSW